MVASEGVGRIARAGERVESRAAVGTDARLWVMGASFCSPNARDAGPAHAFVRPRVA